MTSLVDMSTSKDPPSDSFVRWNLALLDAFFSPSSANEEVWLQTSTETLDDIAPHLGGDRGLCDAVQTGAPWLPDCYRNPFQIAEAAILLVDQRIALRERPPSYADPVELSSIYSGCNAPTYLPYLAVLARTAAENDDGFYRRLRLDLDLPSDWNSPHLAKFSAVWADLQSWTESCEGRFGLFRVRTLGGYRHIGLARSQVVMAPKDTRLIGGVFAQAGLRTGQPLDERTLRHIRQLACQTTYPLSAAFRSALDQTEYAAVIDARLEALFEDWDGSVPRRDRQLRSADGVPDPVDHAEISLCLSFNEDEMSGWRIHWNFPVRDDAQEIELEAAGQTWSTRQLDGANAITCDDTSAATQTFAQSCLAKSASGDVHFVARPAGDGGTAEETLMLRRSPLRVLAPRRSADPARTEFIEHPLRPAGAVLLLASPENANSLLNYLAREGLGFDRPSSDGLPDGWLLIMLDDCGELTEEKRNTLPDGRETRPAPRMMRLTGGRSVNRGGGKQYLNYDLPTLELDASEETRLDAPGLILMEEDGHGDSPQQAVWRTPGRASNARLTAARRFRIELGDNESLRTFTITASVAQQPRETLRLRVASDSGEHVASSGAFCLDPTGGPARHSEGVRGIKVGWIGPSDDVGSFDVTERTIGRPLQTEDVDRVMQSAEVEFLDSLAQCATGSMSYGVARDQLGRLLRRHIEHVKPVEVLLALRTRGHLEIEVNARGHFARIHAIEPAFYELPVTIERVKAFGVMGTLRMNHWRTLAEASSRHLVYLDPRRPWEAPCLRLALGNMDEAHRVGSSMGVLAQHQPSMALAAWSANYMDMVANIGRDAVLAWSANSRSVERLNANALRYFFDRNGVSVVEGVSQQLLRMEDPATGQHRIYLLAMRSDAGPSYGFVRDSRWGTWIALAAFADFARGLDIDDACPWPLPYAESDGTLWVPARAGLPVILERALVLCSGDAPRVVQVLRIESDGNEGLVLRHDADALASPGVSIVYHRMAEGRWLVYRWVPRAIAEVVAGKLRAVLRSA